MPKVTSQFENDSQEYVICTACYRGPCVIGYLALTNPKPQYFYVQDGYTVPEKCPLPNDTKEE